MAVATVYVTEKMSRGYFLSALLCLYYGTREVRRQVRTSRGAIACWKPTCRRNPTFLWLRMETSDGGVYRIVDSET
jgi:hypothetical protein